MGAHNARPFPHMPSHQDARLLLGVLKDTKTLEVQDVPSVAILASRALRLAKLGEDISAAQDTAVALASDPEHPQVLRAAARIYGGPYLGRFLASPFVATSARNRVLEELPAQNAPLIHTCLFDQVLRVSLAWRSREALDIQGTINQDHVEILRGSKQAKTGMIAAELVLQREMDRPRHVTLTIGAKPFEINVPSRQTVASLARNFPLPQDATLWVIVPIFNGSKTLGPCLSSLEREISKTSGARALVIDDGSTDPKTRAILQKMPRSARFHIQRHDANLGFVETVNSGLAQIRQGHVLLLNSDTYLAPGTLGRLLAHLDDPEVATVTPLSNNAGSFSVPKANAVFAAPSKTQADALARKAARLFAGQAVDVLNGNGFCMLISDAARKAVGPLSTAYAQGYYEEVDFCMRASQKGFRHVAAVDCFVSHIGGMSFQSRKKALVARNQKELYRRFPFYPGAYARFQIIDPLGPFRNALMKGSAWKPVEQANDKFSAPRLDFTRLHRPLVIFDPEVTAFGHVEDLFPSVRLCPRSWVRKFIPHAQDHLPRLRQKDDGLDIVTPDGTVLYRAACMPMEQRLI